MDKPFSACYSMAVRAASVALVLCLPFLVGCGGGSANSNVQPPAPTGNPTISSLSLKSGLVGWTVQIQGSNFGSSQGSSTVTFNGTTATSIPAWTDGAIVAKIPSGATSGKVIVTVGGVASNGVTLNVISTLAAGSISPTAFGFQCSTNQNACGSSFTWPTSVAQPGTLRLWDSKTDWNDIETVKGQYDFTILDGWLDMIAAQNSSPSNAWNTPINVIFTFGFVACVEASSTSGETPKGCIYPPSDFTGTLSGSPSFNAFVTAVVQHCNANGHCVKDLIKNYEMWNEPNNAVFWHDTTLTGETEIFQMVYPAVAIIRANVPNAVIMTMASTNDASYTLSWLQLENANLISGGTLSDVVVWHQYLNKQQTEIAPDDPNNLSAFAAMLNAKTSGGAAWTSKPFRITETGFQAYVTPYGCDTSIFSTNDCIGQMVRWQLIVLSSGGEGMDWYTWNVNIGSQPGYAQAWYFMMQHLVGATFTAPCAAGSDGVTWTCPITEADGTQAQWVWTTNPSGGTYTVPSGYVDYVSLSLASNPPGNATSSISSGQSVNITTMPLLLEQ